MTHMVTLSTRFMGQGDDWKSPLLLHEMDHVAITSDPRAKKLSLQVLFQPMSMQLDAIPLGTDSNAAILAEVEKRVTQRRESLQSLMREGYRQLDERSNHGLEPIASRQEFFAELYCEPWLQALSFPFFDSCKKLVRGKAYQQTDHYRLLDLP